MAYARHHAELSHRDDKGTEVRLHLEAAAARGNPDAIRKLEGPEFPENLAYLWAWVMELHGRSGVGMAGLAPLSYTTIRDWSELTDQYPDPDEVQGLMALDAVLRAGPSATVAKSEPEQVPRKAWPEKAHG